MSDSAGAKPKTSSRPAPTVSILTPAGVGAIAVLRLAGAGAEQVLESTFRPPAGAHADWTADRIHWGTLYDQREPIDDVLVVGRVDVTGPSFDICAHGGVRVVERLVMALGRAGADFADVRPNPSAAWGARSVLDGEILDALSRARTRRAVRFLLHQRSAFPRALQRWLQQAGRGSTVPWRHLQRLHTTARRGRYLVDGAVVAITGPVNAGKSTLMNRLAGAEGALVSDRPGTTLDWVTQETAFEGVPITLIDTPGSGHPQNALDELAVERSRARVADADVRLVVVDGAAPPGLGAQAGRKAAKTALVLNKSDLGRQWTPEQVARFGFRTVVPVSAAQGTNVAALVRGILCILGFDRTDEQHVGLFTERQERLVADLLAEGTPSAAGLCAGLTDLLGLSVEDGGESATMG